MKRKLTLVLVFVVALSLLLSAAPSSAREGVEIVVWFTGDDQQAEALSIAADIWEAETGNTVSVEAVGWGDAYARALTATTSGEGADILMGGMSWGISLGELGGMVNLAEKYPDDIAAIAEASNPGFYEAIVSRDGSIYGVPYNLDIYLMYYRTDLIETPPATWDELRDTIAALQADGAQGMAIVWGNGDWLGFTNVLYQAGGQWYTDDCSAAAVNSDEGLEALDFYVEMFDSLGAPAESTDVGTGLSTGDYPIVIDGEWTASGIDASFPDLAGKWGVAPLPAGPSGAYTAFIGGKMMGIFSFSDNVDTAFDFMKFLGGEASAEAQTAAYFERQNIFVPPQTAWGSYIKGGEVLNEALNAQLLDAVGPPNCYGWEEVNNDVTLQLQAALFEDQDLEDTLYEIEAIMNDGLEEFGK
ncbi:MAG: extracellular solute-binding protein [Anaerolineae bacterium]|nr:extracellular solute-binding protein [Anaerolineae bacterium]